ncbi:hypothetical protein [Escherichia coli]|uniref:hypothetical protein n=1 Tax=Escherichia coli TaxID=562 RepID=UPI0039A05BD8
MKTVTEGLAQATEQLAVEQFYGLETTEPELHEIPGGKRAGIPGAVMVGSPPLNVSV